MHHWGPYVPGSPAEPTHLRPEAHDALAKLVDAGLADAGTLGADSPEAQLALAYIAAAKRYFVALALLAVAGSQFGQLGALARDRAQQAADTMEAAWKAVPDEWQGWLQPPNQVKGMAYSSARLKWGKEPAPDVVPA